MACLPLTKLGVPHLRLRYDTIPGTDL